MKILSKNLKSGIIALQMQSADDVWALYRIVQPGDCASGWTERKIKIGDSTTQRAGAAITKRMLLTITIEKSAYENDGKSVRLLGPIKEGNEYVSAGEYHSFDIDSNSQITIQKINWPAHQLRALDEAVVGGRGTTIIVAFDRTTAMLGSLTAKGFTKIATIDGVVQKKGMDTQKEGSFYADIVKQLVAISERINPTSIVLASSNFWKEPLFKEIDSQQISAEQTKDLRKKSRWIECEDVSERAIQELTTSKEFQQSILAPSQQEVYRTFDEILRRIGTDGAAAYGMQPVEAAAQQSAINITLVSQRLLATAREKGTFEQIESLLNLIEKTGATVHIIGDEFTIQDKIDGLGGIVALLRFAI